MNYLLAICIPTYNRSSSLYNCLLSISKNRLSEKIQICISDNSNRNLNYRTIKKFKKKLNIDYIHNKINIGRVRNYLNVIDMAKSKYVWMIGDDDIILNDAISGLILRLKKFHFIELFYLNTYNENVIDKKFNLLNINFKNLTLSSKFTDEKIMNFKELINPKISNDYLGGMFKIVFNKKNWEKNKHYIQKKIFYEDENFKFLESTFPHVRIIANSFFNSKVYYIGKPYLLSLGGYREWSLLSPIVNLRILEILAEYKKLGLNTYQYIICKNFALRYFLPDILRIIFKIKKIKTYNVKLTKIIFVNFLYPNFYLSIFYYIWYKILSRKL